MRRVIVSILIVIFLLGGCTPQAKQLQDIKLGMSKPDVIKELGDPRVVRGSIKNKYNEIVEVCEYHMQLPMGEHTGEYVAVGICTFGIGFLLDYHPYKDYWLYFVDEQLNKWGEAGDWQIEKSNIYEMRFNSGNNLTSD